MGTPTKISLTLKVLLTLIQPYYLSIMIPRKQTVLKSEIFLIQPDMTIKAPVNLFPLLNIVVLVQIY